MGYKGNNLNVTLPPDILNRIEEGAKAKDMSKSRFVLRLLEKGLELQGEKIVSLNKFGTSFQTVQCENNKHQDCKEVYSNTELNLEAVCKCSCHNRIS